MGEIGQGGLVLCQQIKNRMAGHEMKKWRRGDWLSR